MKTQKTNGQPTKRYLRHLQWQERRARADVELRAWLAEPRPGQIITDDDAKQVADHIRGFYDILHRNGFCSCNSDCLSCVAMTGAAS